MIRRTCGTCGKPVIWALTAANRKWLALDPAPSPDGNQAAYRDGTGGWVTRQLKDDEQPYGYERRLMPHLATCKAKQSPATPPPLPPNVIPINSKRKNRRNSATG